MLKFTRSSMASTEKSTGAIKKRQKRMGPAPIASFEDLSDDKTKIETTPEEQNLAGSVVRLPGIREDLTPISPRVTESPIPHQQFIYPGISLVGSQMQTAQSISPRHMKSPNTPRIDISRASSSSHHGSRDSTPEREEYEGHDPHSAKLGLGFREDGALDLRSSTEELPYQDKHKKAKSHSRSPSLHEEFHRKDSQSSDLLEVAGRTSRVSSIGSQGSANSRISNLSAFSFASRCSSPHKMILETSFCGNKTPDLVKRPEELPGVKIDTEALEKVILSRKHDPTKAILAEGIRVDKSPKQIPLKPMRKENVPPLQQQKVDIKITIDPAQKNGLSRSTPLMSRHVSSSGVEYFYIPLKGALPEDVPGSVISYPKFNKRTLRECKSASPVERRRTTTTSPSPSKRKKGGKPEPKRIVRKPQSLTETRHSNEPQIIRIKLKPDHEYDDEPVTSKSSPIHKPDSLDLKSCPYDSEISRDSVSTQDQQQSSKSSPSVSPKLSRNNVISITPSPTVSRRSSFASLFRSRESTPDSPGGRRLSALSGFIKDASDQFKEVSKHIKSRSRSNSKDTNQSLSAAPSSSESIDCKSKQKSLLSLFKFGRNSETPPKLEAESNVDVIGKVEFKFNENNGTERDHKKFPATPLAGRIIHIPLHSPSYYTERTILHDWSQESQDTVIEANPTEPTTEISEEKPKVEEEQIKTLDKKISKESSTSSENNVFSTQLGDNEIFTTKLPKKDKLEQRNHMSCVDIIVHEASSPVKCDDNGNKEADEKEKDLETQEEIKEEVNIKKEDSSTSLTQPGSSLSSLVSVADGNSSDSERDSEADSIRNNRRSQVLKLKLSEQEIKSLVQDSFEEDLPYVPTTLPQERSSAVPIVPINQRSVYDVKTYPIERPRSTTPLNPSCLEDYCEEIFGYVESVSTTIEKIKISLPRNDSVDKNAKMKSPRINWQEFAESGISTSKPICSTFEEPPPPPLPPRGMQREWIDFEQIPEKRRHPKRIQTIPGREKDKLSKKLSQEGVLYNYVNPDECVCECHDHRVPKPKPKMKEPPPQPMDVEEEDELVPLLDDDGSIEHPVPASSQRCSNISETSVDTISSKEPMVSTSITNSKAIPFGSDLGISNRSSILSEEDHNSNDES